VSKPSASGQVCNPATVRAIVALYAADLKHHIFISKVPYLFVAVENVNNGRLLNGQLEARLQLAFARGQNAVSSR
jgi:hypothetical protein